jgi:glyoxylase-like metal-dependent hydrolase (beta-lactamase superfamily II)
VSSATITVGNVTITAVSDGGGEFPIKLSRVFATVPADAWHPVRERYPHVFAGPDIWNIEFNSFLVRSSGATMLVDTGIGERKIPLLGDAGGQLLDNLRANAIAPTDIDTVFMTHLHLDHVGWNLTSDGAPTFPKARYVVHEADWTDFHRPEQLSGMMGAHIPRTVTPLESLGVLDLLSGEKALTAEVTAIPTPGHTPGHMSLLISSAGEKALITGDAMGHVAQVTEPGWCEVFDSDKELGQRTREQLLDRIEAEGMKVAAEHFPGPGFGKIVRLEGKRYWQAL